MNLSDGVAVAASDVLVVDVEVVEVDVVDVVVVYSPAVREYCSAE